MDCLQHCILAHLDFSVWEETKLRGKCNKFTNSSTDLDHDKRIMGVKMPLIKNTQWLQLAVGNMYKILYQSKRKCLSRYSYSTSLSLVSFLAYGESNQMDLVLGNLAIYCKYLPNQALIINAEIHNIKSECNDAPG